MDNKRLHRRDEEDPIDDSVDLSPFPVFEKEEIIQHILHKKCAVIKLVRKQMLAMDERVNQELKEIKKCKSALGFLLRNKLLLLILLLLPFMAWFLLVYGAKMGALHCCGSSKNMFATRRTNSEDSGVLF